MGENAPAASTAARRTAASASSPEWERSPAAASLLWVVVDEAAAKFRADNHGGHLVAREQSRLFDALAETIRAHTGGAA